jgi:hypothetical protein
MRKLILTAIAAASLFTGSAAANASVNTEEASAIKIDRAVGGAAGGVADGGRRLAGGAPGGVAEGGGRRLAGGAAGGVAEGGRRLG